MSKEISRRTFLRGTLAGAVVVAGFDTAMRSWVSAAELGHATALAEDFPAFGGVLLLDDASRAAAADDFGHLVHHQPLGLCTKSLDRALLCATSVSSVSLWLMNSQ